ncbi:MAG: DUF554 domain-containing protein [Christensenellales bacterium]|jgi:uncharacterized membrane protein YqgA involved in biofilm formation
MTGVLVNAVLVILGSALGLLFGKLLSDRLNKAVMTGIGLCTLYIGISGTLKGENPLILIAAMVLGVVIGTLLDIDGFVQRLGDRAQTLTRQKGGSVSEGFVTASLLFCVGAMAVVGSLEAGLTGNNATLYTKSALDFVAALFLASSLGFGVALSALSVLVYQGAITLLSGLLAPVMTTSAINELSSAGSLVIVALGLNLIGITKIKVADFLPALFIAPLISIITAFI